MTTTDVHSEEYREQAQKLLNRLDVTCYEFEVPEAEHKALIRHALSTWEKQPEEFGVLARGIQERVAAGDFESLFVKDEAKEPLRFAGRRAEPDEKPRIEFGGDWQFQRLTGRARKIAREATDLTPPQRRLLEIAATCEYRTRGKLFGQQNRGATYKQLAYIGHLCGMDGEARMAWYQVAASVPLSERHAGHIISTLREEVVQ